MNPSEPRSTRSPLAVARRAVPALVGVVVILGLGAAALRVGDANLRTAEDDRHAERVRWVHNVGPNIASDLEAAETSMLVDFGNFTPDDREANTAALQQFLADSTADKPTLVALIDAQGRQLAVVPSATTIDVAALGPAWSEAVAGRTVVTPAFVHDGAVVNAVLMPIRERENGTEVAGEAPWSVVVLIDRAADSQRQSWLAQLGSLSNEPGGLVLVDANGVVFNSWSANDIGRQILDPATVAGLPGDDRPVTWTEVVDGTEITNIGRSLPHGYALVFRQDTDKLYGDLRSAQQGRDTTLLGVLAGALAALVLFQVARERGARRAEARLSALLENSEDLVLVADARGRLGFVSPAVTSLLGHEPDDWRHRPLTEVVHRDDAHRLSELLADPATGPVLNVQLRRAPGPRGEETYEWFDVEASDLTDHREVAGILLTCHAVGQRKILQDELTRQATHDPLTGLPNRAEFSLRLEQLLRSGHPTRRFAVLYVDLDLFKPVNDTLGHDAGDQVLRLVAERLRDAAGEQGFVCRLGGDEFGVLLDHAGEPEALDAAERLREAARAPIPVGASLAHLDATIGIALADPALAIENPELLVRQADRAMYRAKQAGRGRAVLARPTDLVSPSAPTGTAPEPEAGARSGDDGSVPAPTPASAANAAAHRTAPGWYQRVRATAPAVVAAAVIVGVAAVGLHQTRSAQESAELLRVNERQRVTTRSAEFYTRQFDPGRITTIVSNLPWTFDGSPLDQALTKGYGETFTASRGAWDAVLATPDGRILAAYPEGTPLRVAADSPAFRAALNGRPSADPLVEVDGELRSVYASPVVRDGESVAVIVSSQTIRDSFLQDLMTSLGGMGSTNGGWSLVNDQGVAYGSWNPALLGQQVADPEDLVTPEPGATAPSLARGTGRVVTAAIMPTMSNPVPSYLVYAQPAEDFFRDLRIGQRARDLSLVAVVLAAVAGLAFLNHRREQALRRSERRLDAFLQHAHDIVVVLDRHQRATFVSSAVAGLLGYDPADRLGRPLTDVVHPADADRLAEALAPLRVGHSVSIGDVRLQTAAGDYRWFDIDAVDLSDHREVAGVLLTCHEVGQRKAFQDQLAYRAEHDALTGLPNRARFAAHLEELAGSGDRSEFAILFLDLDHFKPVNDTLGHDAGDEVLRQIAHRLTRSLRVDDPDRPDVVCRLGGDEFAILLRDVTGDRARTTADRIIATVAEPIHVADQTVTVGATIGVALSHPDREHPDNAVRHADLAMYQAKDAGRGRWAMVDPDTMAPSR